MLAIEGADVLKGLSINGTRRRGKIIKASTKLSFVVYFKCNVSSEVTIVHFTRQYTQI